MDPKPILGLLIPILALSIPVIAIVGSFVLKLARLKAETAHALPAGEALARLDALEQEVQGLRTELAEAQERLDFAERLLASRPERPQVGPA